MNTQTYNPAGSPRVTDTTARPTVGGQLQRFEELTRKLVDLPEGEVDANRKQDAERPVSPA